MGVENMAVWRDISLMWLILLTLVAALPFGLLFFFVIKGLHRLRQLAKQYLPLAQDRARQVADTAEQVSRKVADPLIGVQAKAAQVDGISKAIFARRKQA
jgi:cell division protein FtsB